MTSRNGWRDQSAAQITRDLRNQGDRISDVFRRITLRLLVRMRTLPTDRPQLVGQF
jgi:hypothetical protein